MALQSSADDTSSRSTVRTLRSSQVDKALGARLPKPGHQALQVLDRMTVVLLAAWSHNVSNQ